MTTPATRNFPSGRADTGGPMGYLARPVTMATLLTMLVQDRLFEHGVKFARVGLMAVHVEEHAFPELEDLGPCPADEAIDIALAVMEEAWDSAMELHGMFRDTINDCLRSVRAEVEEIVVEHVKLRNARPSRVRSGLTDSSGR